MYQGAATHVFSSYSGNPDWNYCPPSTVYHWTGSRESSSTEEFCIWRMIFQRSTKEHWIVRKRTTYCLLYYHEKKAMKITVFWGSAPIPRKPFTLNTFNEAHRKKRKKKKKRQTLNINQVSAECLNTPSLIKSLKYKSRSFSSKCWPGFILDCHARIMV